MPAQLISESEVIDVSSLSLLIYGPPGAWKTSLAQTASNPITLDFDMGAHRSFNRKNVLRFMTWADVNDSFPHIERHQTVVVDTVGRMLDLLSQDIIRANAKHGTIAGGLSIQGWGALKSRFAAWTGFLRTAGKDLVFIAHEKEERDGDDRYMRPDIQGSSYTEVMKFTDVVGYLGLTRAGTRILNCNPSDKNVGKNAANWDAMTVPDLSTNPAFLANLIADAKKVIGHTAQASAHAAAVTDEWTAFLAADPSLDEINSWLPRLSDLKNGTKKQVWHLLQEHCAKCNLLFSRETKMFHRKSREQLEQEVAV